MKIPICVKTSRKMLFLLQLLLIVIGSVHCTSTTSSDNNGECAKYETLDLPASRSFFFYQDGSMKSPELALAAAGMRRKNLLVVEVDVYKVGVYLSQEKIKKLSEARSSVHLKASDEPDPLKLAAPVSSQVTVGISLKFVRAVPANKVVDAIVEALTITGADGAYSKSLMEFSNMLLNSIGSTGVSKNDEIDFAFSGPDGKQINVTVRGKFAGIVSNASLRSRLLDIYTGKKAVAPIVHKILADRFSS